MSRPPLGGEHFDVAIIGGGISGVAIARECARAGRRTLLIEQHDFASGTTSRSTRIIHGGLRYLERGELSLVRESLRERERLLRERPHLVRPLEFLLALAPGSRHSALAIRAGLWLYRKFGDTAPRKKSTATVTELERALDRGEHWSIFSYDDAQCEFPERLVAEWLREALFAGLVSRNYTEALAVEAQDGAVRGLRLRDLASREEYRIRAAHIINATGPWADRTVARVSLSSQQMVGGVRGSHIVISRFPGAPASALYAEGADSRPLFVIPWNGEILVGTTEVSDSADPAAVQPTASEISYLWSSLLRIFPQAARSAIRFSFAGVRPLPFSPGRPLAAVTRRHFLHDHSTEGARGFISVIGGKLTTAASLARECARKIGIACPEPTLALVAMAPANGVRSTLHEWSELVAANAGIAQASARAIAEWHGRSAPCVARLAHACENLRRPLCPHTPHLVAEAVAAVRYECARTLADILLRRVPVALSGHWNGDCSRIAAERIGTALGWSAAQIAAGLEAFEVERHAFLRPASIAGAEHAA